MCPIDNNSMISDEHKVFWDSLQMDILTSNQELTKDDYLAFMERSFIFSLFFRGCPALELIGFQKMLGIKDYGYLILLEFSAQNKTKIANLSLDEFGLHHFIKKVLHHKNCVLGPFITNRIIILISEDMINRAQEHREESIVLCKELIKALEKQYHATITAGIGSSQSIHSLFTSFTDALNCLYYESSDPIVYYQDLKSMDENTKFDYLVAEQHLIEAIRLRKVEAYDYFGLIMEWVKPLSDDAKRNKILEILILADHAMRLDSQEDIKYLDYTGCTLKLMEYSGNQMIDYAYQLFLYITSYVKPQNSIDYSNNIVKATKEYMESHYTDDISLEDMAAQVNISPQYFSKLIKKTTGFNFIDWLSMLRVKKAKELLTNSNLTVKEVCFMVGYKDPNYFSRIFKKRIGITPSEYVKTSSYLNNKS